MDRVSKVVFVKSSARTEECPPPLLPEFAFIGRSNVGKSSLINALCGRKDIAKVSGKPGKTQLINHFLVDDQWYLVDLPGYGFAKVSKQQQATMSKMVNHYLRQRPNLVFAGLLLDSRLEPQAVDLTFMQQLGVVGIPFVLIFTKADKLGFTKAQSAVAKYKKHLLETWESLPPVFVTSAEEHKGMGELLRYIRELAEQMKQAEKDELP